MSCSLRCRQQLAGIVVFRVVEDVIHCSLLHDAAFFHHQHPVAELVHHIQVVGDKEIAEIQLPPQRPQQVQDLGLDGSRPGPW